MAVFVEKTKELDTEQKDDYFSWVGCFSMRTDAETSTPSPPRAEWAQVLAALSRKRVWGAGGRRAAWRSTGQGATREPCAGSLGGQASGSSSLCPRESQLPQGSLGKKPQGRPCLESQTRMSALSRHHLSPVPGLPQCSTRTWHHWPFKNIGEISRSPWARPHPPQLKPATASKHVRGPDTPT